LILPSFSIGLLFSNSTASISRRCDIQSGKEHEVRAMENGGNFKVNSIFEARLPSQDLKPTQTADGRTRERYIRDKYERRKYFDPSGYSNDAAAPVAEAPQTAPAPHVVGPPSDAAKKRLEQQRARKAKEAPTPPRAPPPQPAPAPASAPVDLLDLFALADAPSGPSQQDQAQQDMGKSMSSLSDFLEADKKSHLSRGVSELTKAPNSKQQQQAGLDIMSLYNRANSAPQAFANFGDPHGMQVPQQQMQMMGNHGGDNNMMMMNNHSGGMNGGSMPMMGNHAGNNAMQNMTQMMQNMHVQPSQQQQQMQQQQMMMMTPQQQQQQMYQQMMMMQQQQQMYQQMMMMQQQQQPTLAAMPAQQSSAKKASPEKKDPFAHFAAF
jgi:hypothetical protein